MVVVALIALVQLAVLVMLLAAATTSPTGSQAVDPAQQPKQQIGQLEELTVEAMMAEAQRAQSENDRYPWD